MTAVEPVPLWLFGATGMLAGELARLLDGHPRLQLAGAVSRTEQPLSDAHPHLPPGTHTLPWEQATEQLASRLRAGAPAAAVFALPHGESCAAWTGLKVRLGDDAARLSVVDLAADFRLRDPELYQRAYGRPHPSPEDLPAFEYGLPELRREALTGARRVAAPGCFATALQLATVPAAAAGLLDPQRPWILHGITGSSGSGNEPKPGTHHPHRHGNLWAYSLGGHRHEAELEQALSSLGLAPPIHFVAHSGPFARGIHLTAALPLAAGVDQDQVRAAYHAAYGDEPFVDLLDERVPDLRSVAGSNRVAVAARARDGVLTVLLTLDNLVKGGSGQALQCLNLMLDWPETLGLPRAGLGAC